MLIEEVKKLSPLERLIYWVRERESIRIQKEADQPKPWSNDTILQQHKFCCVRRMDDRVSKWLTEHWYQRYFNHPNMIVACTMARQFNNTESLGAVGFPLEWRPGHVRKTLENRAKVGLKNFSGAYMITGTLGGTKIEQVVNKVVDPLHRNRPDLYLESMERSCKALVPYAGFSTFIAGQVVADLRWAVQGTWADKHTWAPMGLGSKRGLNRLHSRPISTPLKEGQFIKELNELINTLHKKIPSSIMSRLEAHDIQSTLCETDKYVRTLNGEGTPKQRYPGV